MGKRRKKRPARVPGTYSQESILRAARLKLHGKYVLEERKKAQDG